MVMEYANVLKLRHAAGMDLAALSERLQELSEAGIPLAEPEAQTILARIQIAQIAFALPAASLGSCGIDGTPLTFRGRDNGLWICCNGDPEHCWPNSGM